MGMMARMRSLAPWFIITVGGLFVIFMIFSDITMKGLFGNGEVVVGSVAGEDISATEFEAAVDGMLQQQEQQTGRKIEDDQLDYFREQVWNTLVSRKLMENKIKEYGIVVTDEEIRELLLGPNPPAYLTQNFVDSTGKFNRPLYEATLKDPRYKSQIVLLESQIREQLQQQKLQQYLTASINVSEDEILRQYNDQNVKLKADFVLFDLNTVPDAEIKVTDDDLRNYYNKHMSDYKQDAQRKIKYVLFNKKATPQDSVRIKDGLVKNIARIQKDTTSIQSLISAYSDLPYSKDTLTVNMMPAQAKNHLFAAKINDFVGPIAGPEGYTVYHLNARVKGKEPFVRVSQILVKSGTNDNAAKAKADDIYNQLQKGANFAELAKKFSEDPGSAANGGDSGWGGKGTWINEYWEAALKGKVGVLQKPFKSPFGYHIIKVTDRSEERFVVEKIVNKIQPSPTTLAKITRSANDLVKLAEKGDFQKEAEMMKLTVVETPAFGEKPGYIQGLGFNMSLVRFAFDNSVGDVSKVLRSAVGYVVAIVSSEIKAGVRPFEDLKESIKTNVIREKKIEKMMQVAADVKTKLGNNADLKAVTNFYASAKADTTQEFSGVVQPNIGRDYSFIYYCQTAELNKVSEPIKGLRGAYLIKPTLRTRPAQADYVAQRNSLRDRVLQSKKSQFFNQWLNNLKEESKIVDERYKYY